MTQFEPFASTIWTVIHRARRDQREAIDALVKLYRPPVVRYLCVRGAGEDQAEDLAQEVFLRIFQKELLQQVERTKGRFRSFLLGVANNVLREHLQHARARKRGGGAAHVSIEDVDVAAGERDFAREWMLHLVKLAMKRLAAADREARRRDLEVFRAFVGRGRSYEEICKEFGVTAAAVKNAIYETKKRLRHEVSELVNGYACSEEDFAAEMAAFDAATIADR